MKLLQRLMLRLCLAIFVGVGVYGCESNRVVFVPESEGLVRLGPGIRGQVYFWNGSAWELSSNKVDLPEGWFAGTLTPPSQESSVIVRN